MGVKRRDCRGGTRLTAGRPECCSRSSGIARVLVLSRDRGFGRLVGSILNGQEDMTVCGRVGSLQAALRALSRRRVDVVVLAFQGNGRARKKRARWVRWIRSFATKRRADVLLLSSRPDGAQAEQALRAGAAGYLCRQEAPVELGPAIRRVRRGGGPFLGDRAWSARLCRLRIALSIARSEAGRRRASGAPPHSGADDR